MDTGLFNEKLKTFLGWKHPGPIEAMPTLRYPMRSTNFWDGNIPAPLKLNDGHGAGISIRISGMETSRPH